MSVAIFLIVLLFVFVVSGISLFIQEDCLGEALTVTKAVVLVSGIILLVSLTIFCIVMAINLG